MNPIAPPKISELLQQNAPWVIAHRGLSRFFPENTLEAFRAAVKVGADLIELDVSLSQDRVPVVIHDETLDRTTSGSGRVADWSWQALRELDAGSWKGPEHQGARLPTLEAVFQEVGSQIAINVELKPEGFEEAPAADALEQQVLDLIERYGLAESVMLSSFEHRFFPRVRTRTADLPVALLYEALPDPEAALAACRAWGAISVNPQAVELTEAWAVALHEGGLRILPWTVDEPAEMRKLLGWGVDGFFTNDPQALQSVLGSWEPNA